MLTLKQKATNGLLTIAIAALFLLPSPAFAGGHGGSLPGFEGSPQTSYGGDGDINWPD